jgi:hypothetical protein
MRSRATQDGALARKGAECAAKTLTSLKQHHAEQAAMSSSSSAPVLRPPERLGSFLPGNRAVPARSSG